MRKRAAPPVVLVTHRPQALRVLGLSLAAAAVALSVVGLWRSGTPAWAWGLVGITWVLVLFLADQAWRRLPIGTWHGHGQSGWRWLPAKADVALLQSQPVHRLRVVWDGQRHLLLTSSDPALRWCWVSESQQTQDWGALRRALFARPRGLSADAAHPSTDQSAVL